MNKFNKIKKDEIIQHFCKWLDNQSIFKKRKEIADYLHISPSHLNNVINGRREANDNLLQNIIILTEFDKLKSKNTSIYPSEERPYLEFTEELRKWFFKQKTWKSQKEIAAYLKMPYSTFRKFFQGRAFPKGETRKKLYEITGISILEYKELPKKDKKNKSTIIRTTDSLEKNMEEIINATKIIQLKVKELNKNILKNNKSLLQKNSLNESNKFVTAFYVLARELLSLRDSGYKEREEVREKISPKDVGYVISFLKAIYDEDKFSDFIFFTKYEFEKGEN